ncbi:MAG TPA: alpha/beta fold hydrolase [Kofleriaceae bacterium]
MTARLHHERVAGPAAARWLVLTHGIFGAGTNLRSVARRIVDRRPEWGTVLVDLRGHGRSDLGEPPHDLAACADDLYALVMQLGGVDALAGHSFGGKVVLAARALVRPRQTWILDASPSARSGVSDEANTVIRMLALMERLPREWARRDDFVAAVSADGQPASLAKWLAMNLSPAAGGGFALRLDLAAMRALLADYYERDLWSALEDARFGDVEVVIADRSRTVSDADRARLAHAPPHVHVHLVDAGHWLHVDNPAALVELFAARLP